MTEREFNKSTHFRHMGNGWLRSVPGSATDDMDRDPLTDSTADSTADRTDRLGTDSTAEPLVADKGST
ncbi:hypothetical protein P3T26_007629 [Streptomyces sp. MAA16]|nr:hypothetical protein [Streptomyces sp. MAA16]